MAWMTDVTAAPHGGESLQDLISRVGGALDGGALGGRPWPDGLSVVVAAPLVIRAAIGSSAGRTEFAAVRAWTSSRCRRPTSPVTQAAGNCGRCCRGGRWRRPGVVNARGTTVVTDPLSIVRQGASAWLSPSSTATAIRMVSPWLTSTIWSVASRSPISGDASSATILRATSSRDSAPVYRTAGSVRSTPASLAVASRVVRPSSSPRDCSRSSVVGMGVSPRTGPMIPAVCTARVRSEVSSRTGRVPTSSRAASTAWRRPRTVNAGSSRCPCTRCCRFQVDCPCRTRWTVGSGGGPVFPTTVIPRTVIPRTSDPGRSGRTRRPSR